MKRLIRWEGATGVFEDAIGCEFTVFPGNIRAVSTRETDGEFSPVPGNAPAATGRESVEDTEVYANEGAELVAY